MKQKGERWDNDQPDADKLKKFWEDVWGESVDHKDLQSEVNVTKQEKVDIAKENLKKIFGRMPN